MPERLTADEITTALEALPGWEGDQERLHRTVPVKDQDRGDLTNSIGAVADELDHHPDLTDTSDGLQISLTTHSAGGVTERDVELATRLDRLLAGGVAWDKY